MAQNREYEIIIYSNFNGSILTLWAKLSYSKYEILKIFFNQKVVVIDRVYYTLYIQEKFLSKSEFLN